MAGGPYDAGFTAPNIGPGASMIMAALNASRQDARANEYLRLQQEAMRRGEERESAEAARKKEADDYKRKVDAFAAMPMLQRMALRSVGMANANPYGVRFDESYESPDRGRADAEVGRFLAAEQAPPVPTQLPHQLGPGEEGPAYSPTTDELMTAATTGAPMDVMSQAAANSFGAPTRKLSATVQGQRFEVPKQSETTPFGAEYDAIYQGLIDTGEDPHKAMQYVASQYKADQTQENIAKRTADRTAAEIAARDRSREDTQTFQAQQDELYRRTFGQAAYLARLAAARVDPSGGADPTVMAALTDYAIKNPGDQTGLYRKAAEFEAPGKAVSTVIGATKPTESQTRDAQQATVGLRALDAIESSGYKPTREEIQKWINNQRLVQGAEGTGIKGFGLTIGQNLPGAPVPQSETEGLSPQAQDYFANVRRYMETIGRKQSGAAISPSEWTNFFNQYGPSSRGGLKAARDYLNDQMRTAGVAGKSIQGGGDQARRPDKVVGNRRFRWNGRAYVEVK